MVSEKIEESLRREIESYVESRLSGIKQELAQLQTQLNESLQRILESEGEAQWDGSLASTVAEHLHAAHERGVELAAAESARSQASSDMAIIKAAIEEIEGQHSQTEILKTLVNRASSFAPRVVFFLVKGDQARGWRARGLEGSVGDDAVQQIAFGLEADTLVGEVVRSRETWSGTPNTHAEDYLLLNRLSEQAPHRMVAVPLVVRGRAVAALYADSAGLDADAINLEALEAMVRVAGMAVGLLSVAHAKAPAPSAEPVAKPQEEAREVHEAAPPYTPVRIYDEPAPPVPVEPIESAAPEPVQEVVEEPAAFTPETELPAAEPYTIPEPAPVQPAAASQPVEPDVAPTTARRRYGSYDVDLPVEVFDEDEKRQHNDARRFARLLVSEIKLYNEQKVVEGRSGGNLYERLREYIDRSREMYDKRVKPGVANKYDYFHHELVNTLAEGDASKLGAAYPGATVSA